METVTVGTTTLSVKKEFSGIQNWVNEIIVLTRLLGYKMNENELSSFNDPILWIFDKNGFNVFLIEFNAINSTLTDLEIIIYEERFYAEDEEDVFYAYSLQPAQKWWDKIKELL